MRNRALHDALRDFALEAAARLVRATENGAEIEFALDEGHEGSATLYRYRPLTEKFIGARWLELRGLPAFDPAARALGTGARSYLRRRGEPGADAEPALRMMLERLYEDSTSFAFPEERFERVYASVERSLYAGTVHATIVAPLVGLRLEGARVVLGRDLSLVDVALLAPAPSPAWLDRQDEDDAEHPVTAYLLLERDLPSDAPLPLGEARLRFRSALMALRLLDRGGVALGPLGFSRVGEGRWQPLRLDPSGHGRGPRRALASDDVEELRELLHGLETGPSDGPLAWALDRFEMGLERESDLGALSDYLLALRALLDRGRGGEPATVALRLAALCAVEEDRRGVQRRIESAFALEPFVVEGGLAAARGERYVEAVGRDGPQTLVRELEDALRHLLAGVVRDELDPDLAGAADEILLHSAEPAEIRVRRWADEDDEFAEGADAARPPEDPEDADFGSARPAPRSPARPALGVIDRAPAASGAPAGNPRESPRGPVALHRLPHRRSERDPELEPDVDDEDDSFSAPV
jgi:hypothetical protein